MTTQTTILTQKTCDVIDHWLTKFPEAQRRSAVIAALTSAQDENNGYLTPEIMDAVGTYLDIPKIWVYEVATFYDMYDLKPAGKCKIRVCNNISCMKRGSEDIIKHLENKLDIKAGETTADGNITLKKVECLAACANAPMMMVDLDYHVDLTPEKVDEILADIKNKAANPEVQS